MIFALVLSFALLYFFAATKSSFDYSKFCCFKIVKEQELLR